MRRIAFWDAGAPGYQWIELVNKRVFAGQPLPPASHRIYTYMTMAMHDATIATWESKYFYKRPRPREVDTEPDAGAADAQQPLLSLRARCCRRSRRHRAGIFPSR